MKRFFLCVLPACILFGCGKKMPSSSTNPVAEKNKTITVDSASSRKGPWEHQDLVFVLATASYDDKGRMTKQAISFRELSSGDTATHLLFDIDIKKFGGAVSTTGYNTSGAWYPVQYTRDLSKVYICIERADEMDGIFYFCKLMEYQVATKTFKEIISFDESMSSWYFVEANHTIYWPDDSTKQIIACRVDSAQLDTLHPPIDSLGSCEYFMENNKLQVIADKYANITRWEIDPATNSITKHPLYTKGPYHKKASFTGTSYHKGYVVETYMEEHEKESGVIMHSPAGIIRKLIDFRNYYTHWIDDDHFTLETEDKLLILDKQLEITAELKLSKIHVEDAFTDALVLTYWNEGWHYMVYSADFSHYINLEELGLDPNILYIGVKE